MKKEKLQALSEVFAGLIGILLIANAVCQYVSDDYQSTINDTVMEIVQKEAELTRNHISTLLTGAWTELAQDIKVATLMATIDKTNQVPPDIIEKMYRDTNKSGLIEYFNKLSNDSTGNIQALRSVIGSEMATQQHWSIAARATLYLALIMSLILILFSWHVFAKSR